MPHLVKILAILCLACGLIAGFFGFMIGMMFALGASMMRDPSLGVLIILCPIAASFPFLIVSFFLWRARPWARRAFVVLLTLMLLPLAAILGSELGLETSAPLDIAAPFMLLLAVLVLTITPTTRKAFGQPPGRWWLEAGLTVLPVLLVLSAETISMTSIRHEVEAAYPTASPSMNGYLQGTESRRAHTGMMLTLGFI